jgi:ABC-type transport system substrate-binding protein
MTGTGPWIFDEWVDGQYVHFKKNNNYWAGKNSKYDEVYLRIILEPSVAIAGHLAGDIDAYVPGGGISKELLPLYKGQNNIEVISYPSGTQLYLEFQCREGAVFSDLRVRKAFSMAIDRQVLVDNVLQGGALTSGLIPPETIGYDPNCPIYEFDTAGAKTLLASSSYKGQPLKLSTSVNTPKAEELLLAISEMVNAAGFNTSIEIVEYAAFGDKRAKGQYDVFLTGVTHQGGDPFIFFNSRLLNDIYTSNYRTPAMNTLIQASNVELDLKKRAALFTKVNEIVRLEYAPIVTLARMELSFARNTGITGIDYFSDGWFYFRHLGR